MRPWGCGFHKHCFRRGECPAAIDQRYGITHASGRFAGHGMLRHGTLNLTAQIRGPLGPAHLDPDQAVADAEAVVGEAGELLEAAAGGIQVEQQVEDDEDDADGLADEQAGCAV